MEQYIVPQGLIVRIDYAESNMIKPVIYWFTGTSTFCIGSQDIIIGGELIYYCHWTFHFQHFYDLCSTHISRVLKPFSSSAFRLQHFLGGVCTYLRQSLDRVYFFLLPASSGMKTLTVKSPLSVPYLFFTRMLYLPLSNVFTPVTKKLANLPDSNLRMMCPSVVISLSFFSQVTSGTGSPEMLHVRLRAWRDKREPTE